jgi:hypothetical protein
MSEPTAEQASEHPFFNVLLPVEVFISGTFCSISSGLTRVSFVGVQTKTSP